MNNNVLQFGLIGAGGIAQSYVQAFRDMDQATVAAVADVRLEAARALADDAGCPAFRSHTHLAEEADLDAVLVCTPPDTHPDICIFFLDRNIPVLCEKPIAIDLSSAKTVIETAKRNDALFTMASKFRFVNDVIRAKSILESGILGEIILFENAFTARVDMSGRWNSDPAVSGGGVLIDNGTHSIDLIRYFLGPIQEVQAVEGKRVQGLSVEDTVRIFTRSHAGVLGTIDLSWSINKELESFIYIYGSNGTVRVGWRESKYRQSTSQSWIPFGDGYDKIQALRSQLLNFSNAIRKEEPLRISAEDAFASVAVVETAYESLRENHWVSIPATGEAS